MSTPEAAASQSRLRRAVDLVGSGMLVVSLVAFVGRFWALAVVLAVVLTLWCLLGRRLKDAALALSVAASLWAGVALDFAGFATEPQNVYRLAATGIAVVVLVLGRFELGRWKQARASERIQGAQLPEPIDHRRSHHPITWLAVVGVASLSSLVLGTQVGRHQPGVVERFKTVPVAVPIVVPADPGEPELDVTVLAAMCDPAAIGEGASDEARALLRSLVETYPRSDQSVDLDEPCIRARAEVGRDGTTFQLVDRGPGADAADKWTDWYLVANPVLDQTAWVQRGAIDALRTSQNVGSVTELDLAAAFGGALEWVHVCGEGDFIPIVANQGPSTGTLTAVLLRAQGADSDGSPARYYVVTPRMVGPWLELSDLAGRVLFPTSDERSHIAGVAQYFEGTLAASNPTLTNRTDVEGLIDRCSAN